MPGISDTLQKLQLLAETLYKNYGEPVFIPKWPFCLVYVLPREYVSQGGIWLPNNEKQNKVVLEGIVLTTWNSPSHGEPEVKVGDHVLFPHFAGWPMSRKSFEHFRFVKEVPDSISRKHNIEDYMFATLNYKRSTAKLLQQCIHELEIGEDLSKKLQDNFVIYSKKEISRTISGK